MSTFIVSHKSTRLQDFAAISLSGLCLMHCLGTSLLIGLAAGSKLFDLWHSELIHVVLLIIAAPLTLWTLVRSYRCHGSGLALLLGIAGLKLMALALIFSADSVAETRITVAGVLLLAVGHLINLRAHSLAQAAE
jgi:MerC mercury resistance protein